MAQYIVSFDNCGDTLYVAVETPNNAWSKASICFKAAALVIEKTKTQYFHDYECGWAMKYWSPSVFEVADRSKSHWTQERYDQAVECGGIYFYDSMKAMTQYYELNGQ